MASDKNRRPAWLDTGKISEALASQLQPDESRIKDILAKALSLESLESGEIVALLRARKEYREILATADLVKRKVWGDRIAITAPLHIDNHCACECVYCAYQNKSEAVERRRLNPDDIRAAGLNLIRQGHKSATLVSGEGENSDPEYLAGCVGALFALASGNGALREINLDVGPLSEAEYSQLGKAAIGRIDIYQETYFERNYHEAHLSGPKSDFYARLNAPDAVIASGLPKIGLGLALGLGPWDYDLLALAQHAAHLAGLNNKAKIAVNLHRVLPGPGGAYKPPFAMNDEEFLRYVAICRLAIPYAELALAAREPGRMWIQACAMGGSQLIAGSLANVYASWADAPGEREPFPRLIASHLDDLVRTLLTESRCAPVLGPLQPEVADESLGGAAFNAEALASLLEFIIAYATPYTAELGEKFIASRLAEMDGKERIRAEALLLKTRNAMANPL